MSILYIGTILDAGTISVNKINKNLFTHGGHGLVGKINKTYHIQNAIYWKVIRSKEKKKAGKGG